MPGQTNSPVTSRLFVQEAAGQPLKFVAAVGVRGVVIDPRQLEFTKFVDENGVETMSVPRYPNPSNFDVNFGKYFLKWFSIHRAMKQGCRPNFFVANAYCEDASRIDDPTYYQDAAWLYTVTASSGYQMGDNIIISLNANQGVMREDRVAFVHDYGTLVGKYVYSKVGGPAVNPIKSLAVVDSGQCSDVICHPCDAAGCLDLLINDGSNFEQSTDGGVTWNAIATSGAGVAQAFGGVAFMVEPTTIKLSSDVTAVIANWTSAVADVSFAGLSNIAQIDARTLVVGGTEGAVWRSGDGGGNWKQIRSGVSGNYDIVALGYNHDTATLVAVAKLSTVIYIQVSPDRGKTWNVIGTSLAAETYGANTNPQVISAGGITYVIVNGNLWMVTCSGAGVATAVTVAVAGATGKISGIGIVNPKSPNQIWLTTSDGKIFISNDGLSSAKAEPLPFTISTADSVVNPVAVCHTKYGDSLLFGFGDGLYQGRDWDSFFVS